MKQMCDTAIRQSKSDYSALHKSMQSFAETKSDATEEDWKKLLSGLADKQTIECNQWFDDIEKFAVEMLRKMPEESRETSANIYKLGYLPLAIWSVPSLTGSGTFSTDPTNSTKSSRNSVERLTNGLPLP